MKKITFLTLMMILGMSSVSLGKSYLCISDVVRYISYVGDEWKVYKTINYETSTHHHLNPSSSGLC